MVIETTTQLDPESLVARILVELETNPAAQQMLLRAMLTNEFLGMPARLDAIEKDVAEMKIDIAALKDDMKKAQDDIAYLRGSDLEIRLHRNLRSIVSQRLDLMRPRIMQSQLQEPLNEFDDEVYDAHRAGRINREQYRRIERTDFIMRARLPDTHAPVLVAVEASATVDAHDIDRARESADVLATVFGLETIAVVAGYRIDPRDSERAEAANVRYVPAN